MPAGLRVIGRLFVEPRHPRPDEPCMAPQRTPARRLTHFDTARNHHPFHDAPMRRADVARGRPGRNKICRKSGRLGCAERKHADKRKREGKRFHCYMFLRPRSRFNRPRSLRGGFYLRSGFGCGIVAAIFSTKFTSDKRPRYRLGRGSARRGIRHGVSVDLRKHSRRPAFVVLVLLPLVLLAL